MDFVEICNVKKAIIKAAKRIINSDKMCRSYSDLNFGVTFFGTQCICYFVCHWVLLLQGTGIQRQERSVFSNTR